MFPLLSVGVSQLSLPPQSSSTGQWSIITIGEDWYAIAKAGVYSQTNRLVTPTTHGLGLRLVVWMFEFCSYSVP